MHYAALRDHKEIAELLIEKGAEVNAKDRLGMTVLHWAALGGQKEIVELLIKSGAEVNARDKSNRIPARLAVVVGDIQLTSFLLDIGKNTADSNAISDNKEVAECLEKLLLKKGLKKSAPGVVIGSVCAIGGIIGLSLLKSHKLEVGISLLVAGLLAIACSLALGATLLKPSPSTDVKESLLQAQVGGQQH